MYLTVLGRAAWATHLKHFKTRLGPLIACTWVSSSPRLQGHCDKNEHIWTHHLPAHFCCCHRVRWWIGRRRLNINSQHGQENSATISISSAQKALRQESFHKKLRFGVPVRPLWFGVRALISTGFLGGREEGMEVCRFNWFNTYVWESPIISPHSDHIFICTATVTKQSLNHKDFKPKGVDTLRSGNVVLAQCWSISLSSGSRVKTKKNGPNNKMGWAIYLWL